MFAIIEMNIKFIEKNGNFLMLGGENMLIEVFTFGDFDIKINKKSVLEKSIRANKNLELFKYFITYKNKKLAPGTIVEDLWRDDEPYMLG
jgi:two-component SAPR family response regulator